MARAFQSDCMTYTTTPAQHTENSINIPPLLTPVCPCCSYLLMPLFSSLLFMKLFLYRITNTISASPHAPSILTACKKSVYQTTALFRTFTNNNSLCLTLSCPLMDARTPFYWCRRFSNGLSCWWCSVSPRIIKCLPASPFHPCWFLLSWFTTFTTSLSKINALFT